MRGTMREKGLAFCLSSTTGVSLESRPVEGLFKRSSLDAWRLYSGPRITWVSFMQQDPGRNTVQPEGQQGSLGKPGEESHEEYVLKGEWLHE